MPMLVRSRRSGKAFELRVIHPKLPKPAYRTFDHEADARRAGELALAALERGEVPPWLQRSMKVDRQLAPGTIRKRKGALSRVLDWFVKAHPLHLSTNPLDKLPRGYSGYDEHTCELLAEEGIDTPEDVERNRRIDPEEERQIIRFLEQRLEQAQTPEANSAAARAARAWPCWLQRYV